MSVESNFYSMQEPAISETDSVSVSIELDPRMEENSSESHSSEKKKKETDPEFFSCLLQPHIPDSDPSYVGIRRFLLYNKASSGIDRRKDWKCNGRSYAAYRNYIRRPRNWESLHIPSQPSTPGQRVIYWLMPQWTVGFISKSTLYLFGGGKLDFKQGITFQPSSKPPYKFQFKSE